jgi:putative colanic acid biosynthesis acetyltransferase WcaF
LTQQGPDILSNRRARKWSSKQLLGRALWETLQCPLFRWTPRQFWGWRRWILRMFGARVGSRVHIHPSVKIAIPWNLRIDENAAIGDGAILYSLGLISIGANATISQYAHLCAGSHDFRKPDMPLTKPPIEIGAGAWICADAFIGPGVCIGEICVVGARAVVVRSVARGAIVAGNPATQVGTRVKAVE